MTDESLPLLFIFRTILHQESTWMLLVAADESVKGGPTSPPPTFSLPAFPSLSRTPVDRYLPDPPLPVDRLGITLEHSSSSVLLLDKQFAQRRFWLPSVLYLRSSMFCCEGCGREVVARSAEECSE